MATLDHLVYATDDLDRTVSHLTALLGVRPSVGGRHVGWGTRNELLSFGDGTYFEIIGPDLSQPEPDGPRPFDVDRIVGERLVAWAVAVRDIDDVVASAKARGYDPGSANAMQRATADGQTLAWRLTTPPLEEFGGCVPFLLDWGVLLGSPLHPSSTATPGVRLIGLRAAHPEPQRVQHALAALDVVFDVERSDTARLIADLETPTGRITLS